MGHIQFTHLLIFIMIRFLHVHATGEECGFSKTTITEAQVTKNMETFCKQKGGSSYDTCLKNIKPYFNEIVEDSDTIKQYVNDICHQIDANECITMTIKLKGFCYDMKRTINLSKSVPNLYLHVFPEKSKTPLGEFDLYFESYNSYGGKTYGRFEIEKCMGHITEALNIFKNHYSKWFKENDQKGDCNCIEVIGLQGIIRRNGFTTVKQSQLYNDFCVNNDPTKKREHWWNLKQLKEIADENHLSYDDKKKFIKSTASIGKAGWLRDTDSEWRFEFIHSYLTRKDLDPDSSYEDRTEMLAAAIKAGFSMKDFTDFVLKTNVARFKSAKCRYDVITSVYNYDTNDKHFWKKNPKSIFNVNLEILIQIFKESYPNQNCLSFAERLRKFQEDIDKLNINSGKLGSILNEAKTDKTNFDNILLKSV